MFSRRDMLKTTVAGLAVALFPGCTREEDCPACDAAGIPYKISLAQWSLNKSFFGRNGYAKVDPLEFAAIASGTYGIMAVEYVNQMYMDKKNDDAYLTELKKRADDAGVKSVLIMCDREGNLGDPDAAKRDLAVTNHHRWVEWAKHLGCHSIRVNAASSGEYDEQVKLAADGLHKLTEFAATHKIGVIVENHGGLSSTGVWLAKVMKTVNHPNCGTLPDFGNFKIDKAKDIEYDRYKGVAELMPFAKGVSAKTYDFDEAGNETTIDYPRIMKIVLDAGYKGYVGIEYEGSRMSEKDGITATKALLNKVGAALAAEKAVKKA
jgi:sugar phosphate isomerase/epimerase